MPRLLKLICKFSINGASAPLSWAAVLSVALLGSAIGAAVSLAWMAPQLARQAEELHSCTEAEATRLKAEKTDAAKHMEKVLGARDTKAVADTKDSAAVRERVIWRTKYVPNPSTLRCNTDQWLRLHDAAALGAAPGDLAELSPEGVAVVGDAEILDVVTRNYDTYRRVARERDACRAELASAYGQPLMP